ncbi:aldehyde dehydrogenase (NADP(+)) [Collimonas sp.]|jgi:alpha-ketoglutaric semialdehyde dehydrogenase|uniref:aldehyde dehydrogenase (NADP(+)) n=1 Tax=Collimonas sp. TaxID=1963772 RepID=UPI002CEA4AF1|nr:aldehyde dehydrogenase (NADP(+)) [Collimonas sp.]HWW06100.1 aldehyde dehydrogenase (NADP(+)) [Collimonas sp.]
MPISGQSIIGASQSNSQGAVFQAFDPVHGKQIGPDFHSAEAQDVERACVLAQAAFDTYRETAQETRARFLETIAQQILDIGDELILRAMAESGLPRARLEGERGRTTGQLRLFAAVLREGSWNDARIDPALPERLPQPRVDLRLRNIAIGPVAVFGASNFPLAFSVAGGDTAAALAAGCPVVVKAHPAHPGTSELVARAVQQAVAICNLPEGVFSLLTGIGNALGTALVQNRHIQAVAFTGSRQGGLALMQVAAARPQPIPVYAEMSSINPVYLLPAALAARGDAIAKGFADSVTLGAGQFCTNPGLVLGLAGVDFERFAQLAGQELAQRSAAAMLTAGIHAAYERGVATLAAQADVRQSGQGAAAAGCQAVPALFATSAAAFLANPQLSAEVFGPVSLLVACATETELLQVTEQLEGQLTATLQMDEGDEGDKTLARRLLPVLERKVGRILANGFPTGVEVSHAMMHGGPFPATSDSRSTSVGSAAIYRFLRPVSYQNLAQDLLPAALQDANPLAIWQRRDGQLGK